MNDMVQSLWPPSISQLLVKVEPSDNYGVRRQSAAATALWNRTAGSCRCSAPRQARRAKAVSRFACHRSPKNNQQLRDAPLWPDAMEMGFHLRRCVGYDESFIGEVARVMEFHPAWQIYRTDLETFSA